MRNADTIIRIKRSVTNSFLRLYCMITWYHLRSKSASFEIDLNLSSLERFVFHRPSSGFFRFSNGSHNKASKKKKRRCGPVIVARTRCGRCIFNRGKHEKWKHVCYSKNAGCKSKLDAIYLLYMVNTTLERTGAWFFLSLFHLRTHQPSLFITVF